MTGSPQASLRDLVIHGRSIPARWSRADRALCIALLAITSGACDSPSAPPRAAGLTPVAAPATGVVGTLLATPVRVKVTDSRGAALAGATVAWAPTGGAVAEPTSRTNSNGIAETRWTLGTVAGAQVLTASIVGNASVTPLQFTVMAAAGPTTGVTIRSASLALQPLESVTLVADVAPDQYGNAVTTTVVWSSTNAESVPITADGRISAQRAGRSTVRASVGTLSAEATVQVVANWRAIGAGRVHSCALDELGYAFCWGENADGQLGVSGIAYDSTPRPVSGARRFASLVVGRDHACGLTSGGIAYCWGQNTSGQLGIGVATNEGIRTPTAVTGGHSFVSLTSSGVHTCGLTTPGKAYCWGWEGEGELGNGRSLTFTSQPAPVEVLGGLTFTSLVAGGSHTCGVTSSRILYCWGNNFEGQVGDGGGSGYRTTPVEVAGDLIPTRLMTGGGHSCGLDGASRTWCWGSNTVGQLGDGTFETRFVPTAITTPVPFTALSGGNRHTCALDAAGQAFCWGYNETGQVGDGTLLRKGAPTAVATDARFTLVAGGYGHSCAVTAQGRAYCWGANQVGQLGVGTFAQRTTPALVAAP